MHRIYIACLFAVCVICQGHQTAPPGVQATIYSTTNCVPCRLYVDQVKREMPADGWIVRNATDKDAASAHVILTKATKVDRLDRFPTTIIRRDGRELDRIVGRITPTQLADAINKHAQRK